MRVLFLHDKYVQDGGAEITFLHVALDAPVITANIDKKRVAELAFMRNMKAMANLKKGEALPALK